MRACAASPGARLEIIIRTFMADHLELGAAVRRFMEVTFGEVSAGLLAELLGDESGAERDSLLDLIFFPDPPLRIAIEAILENHPLNEADLTRLRQRLKADPVAARLQVPGADRPVPLEMPGFAVDGLLTRLNLLWRPVAGLTAAVARLDARPFPHTAPGREARLHLRVWLRNAGLRQTPAQVQFLCAFLERLPADETGFVDKLDFTLVFMKEHEHAGNLYQALMARKRFLYRHLLAARDAALLAARNNMETLVMTGVRTPYLDVAAAEGALVMIDDIATAVFGRTEFLEGAPRSIDLGGHAGGIDPEELIRQLS
jgi:hypothetical protein